VSQFITNIFFYIFSNFHYVTDVRDNFTSKKYADRTK